MDFHDLEGTALKGIEAWKIGAADWACYIHDRAGNSANRGQIEEMAEKCVATGGGHVGFFKTLYKDDVINIYHMAE